MVTAFTCTTPDEGWGLYSHFISGLLVVIGANSVAPKEEDEACQNKRERILADAWAKLLGNLYMIMRRMLFHHYLYDAGKMQQIVDLIVRLDLRQPEARAQVLARYKEIKLQVN